jgi:DNA-binding transcriptional ArsR family regulator
VGTVNDTERADSRRRSRESQLFSTGTKTTERNRMEKALWYLLTATRGGANRARIIDALTDRPKNANELADELDVGYKTIRHHMEQLEDHDIVESGDESYAKLYFLTDRFDTYRDTFEDIVEQMDT